MNSKALASCHPYWGKKRATPLNTIPNPRTKGKIARGPNLRPVSAINTRKVPSTIIPYEWVNARSGVRYGTVSIVKVISLEGLVDKYW